MQRGLNSTFLPRKTLEALGFARLGEDILIHSTAVIVDCGKVSLGSRVRIDPYVIISARGGVVIGDNTHIGGHSVLAGAETVTIADFVNISHYVGIFTTNEDISGRTLSNPTVKNVRGGARSAPIVFERHSGIGTGSIVLPGARLAEGSIVGAMSRVGRPLKPWTTYAGIPARRIRERSRELLDQEREYQTLLATMPVGS